MNKIISIIGSMLIPFLLGGCVQKVYYDVDVNTIGNATEGAKKYVLRAEKGINENDLEYKEYSSYIHRALQEKGFIETTFTNADIAIFFGYGIGNPRNNQYSYSVPTFGVTGYSSSTTYGTINSYGNSASYSGTTYHTPTYGVTGSQSYSGSYTTFDRFISLQAIDIKVFNKTKRIQPIWKTTITSTGSSSDLRAVFPYLVYASKPYLGQNTGQKVNILLDAKNEDVMRMKETNYQK